MSKVLAPIIFFVISVGLFFSYIKPAYTTLQDWQALDAQLDVALEDAKVLTATVSELLVSFNEIPKTDSKKLAKLLPDNLDVVRLIIDVDALAEKSNLTITKFDIPRAVAEPAPDRRQTTTPDPIGSAVLTLTCEGEYQDFKAWILAIEKSLSLMDVTSLSVEALDATAEQPGNTQEYVVGIRTYWLK